MANDIATTDQPAAQLVTGATEELFTQSTGYSRDGATRVVNAVLTVIGATMPNDLTPAAQFGGAINVLGMALAEVIAGSGASPEQRASVIKSISEFITKSSDDLARHYAEIAHLAKFTAATTDENLRSNEAAGAPN